MKSRTSYTLSAIEPPDGVQLCRFRSPPPRETERAASDFGAMVPQRESEASPEDDRLGRC